MAITLNQHRFGVTQAVIKGFTDSRAPLPGLAAFFPSVTTRAKQVSFEVMRNKQLVAVDVQRCTDPNRNTFSNSTEKIFEPPFFSESFDFTACQAYDVTFGMGVAPNAVNVDTLISSANRYLSELKYKIERAVNLQRASVLQYGTVSMINGDSIDYRRKAESMEVLTGTRRWSQTSTSDPVADLSAGADFLRNEGLSAGGTINVIMGSTAFSEFMTSAKVLSVAAIFNQIRRVNIDMPRINNTTGMNFQGQIGGTDYLFNIWTYNDVYENANGTKSKYIGDNMVIMIPDDFDGVTVYAGIPFVFGDQFSGQYVAPVEAEYLVHDVIDQVKKSWQFIVESAPLVIPRSVDRLFTYQVY